MAKYPMLSLIAAQQLERLKSWEDINSPSDLIDYIKRNLAVDPNQLLAFQEIVSSGTEPSGEQRGSLWIKTDGYPAVGVFVGNRYQLIAQYPFDVPLLWTKPSSEFPAYLTRIEEEDLTAYGLENPGVYFYFMLKSAP